MASHQKCERPSGTTNRGLHPARDLLPGVEIYGQNEIYELARSPECALTRVLGPVSCQRRGATGETGFMENLYRKLGKDNGERLAKSQRNEKMKSSGVDQRSCKLSEEQVKTVQEQGLEEKLKQVFWKERRWDRRVPEESKSYSPCGINVGLKSLYLAWCYLVKRHWRACRTRKLLRRGRRDSGSA